LILADEPTGNLDRATGDEVVRLLEAAECQRRHADRRHARPALGKRARRRIDMEDGMIRARHAAAAVA
jgi:putative ABC transport system ATP-binding protein